MAVETFKIEIAQEKLDDLARRLENVNLPHDFANDDWGYGTNGNYLTELLDYWRSDYDWREQEARMNSYDHFKTVIDDVPIHFIHKKGVGPNPKPLLLSHGWPWTFWDFHKVIGPLTDPAAYGGNAEDAFDVVVPSLPGFVFSTPLQKTGIHWASTADLWVKLMCDELGYDKFYAHGGDWGALATSQLGHKYGDKLHGIHMSNAFPLPVFSGHRPWSMGDGMITENSSSDHISAVVKWERKFASHVAVHMLDPQTLAYAMHDSPVGLCAWLIERRRAWSDCRGDIESRFSKEHLINTIMLYWLTDSFVTAVRYYQEAAKYDWQPSHPRLPAIEPPTALSLFEFDLPPGQTNWQADYYNLAFMNVRDSGGHFGAYEEPEAIITDIRRLLNLK